MPKNDIYLKNKLNLLSEIDIGIGGRVAEEVFFGNTNITTGCSSDLNTITEKAYNMLINFSMLNKLSVSNNYKSYSENTKFENEKIIKILLNVL